MTLFFRIALFSCLLLPLGGLACNHAYAQEQKTPDNAHFQPLEDMLRYAYLNNPTLQAQRAALLATNEGLPQALSGWKPTLSVNGAVSHANIDDSTRNTDDGTTSKTMALALSQPLYRGGRTMAATKAAQQVIAAQRWLLQEEEQILLLSVTTVYMDVVRDQALLELRQKNEAVIAKQLEATESRFNVGQLTKTDVLQAESRLAQALSERIRAQGDMQSSLASYEQITGQNAGELGNPALHLPLPEDLNVALKTAEKQNPVLRSKMALHRAAQKNTDEVFGALLPTVSLSADLEKTYDPQPGSLPDKTSKTVGISASIPLYSAGNTRSRVRQAKYTAHQRYKEILEARRAARQKTIVAWETLKSVQAEILARESQVEASRLARAGVYSESDVGARTILDTLDADQEFLEAQVELIKVRRDEIVSIFTLMKETGTLTPQTLGFPELQENHDATLYTAKWKILRMNVDID